jgi:hypothetical protein
MHTKSGSVVILIFPLQVHTFSVDVFLFIYIYDSVFGYSSLNTVDILFSDNQGNHYSCISDDYHYINLFKSYHKSVKLSCWFPLFIPPA